MYYTTWCFGDLSNMVDAFILLVRALLSFSIEVASQ